MAVSLSAEEPPLPRLSSAPFHPPRRTQAAAGPGLGVVANPTPRSTSILLLCSRGMQPAPLLDRRGAAPEDLLVLCAVALTDAGTAAARQQQLRRSSRVGGTRSRGDGCFVRKRRDRYNVRRRRSSLLFLAAQSQDKTGRDDGGGGVVLLAFGRLPRSPPASCDEEYRYGRSVASTEGDHHV